MIGRNKNSQSPEILDDGLFYLITWSWRDIHPCSNRTTNLLVAVVVPIPESKTSRFVRGALHTRYKEYALCVIRHGRPFFEHQEMYKILQHQDTDYISGLTKWTLLLLIKSFSRCLSNTTFLTQFLNHHYSIINNEIKYFFIHIQNILLYDFIFLRRIFFFLKNDMLKMTLIITLLNVEIVNFSTETWYILCIWQWTDN